MLSNNEQIASVSNSSINVGPLDEALYSAPIPSPASTLNPFSFSNRNGRFVTESLASFEGDYFNNAPVTGVTDLSGFRVEDMALPEDPSSQSFVSRRTKPPSLREIRAMKSIFPLSSESAFPSSNQDTGEQRAEATSSQQVLAQLLAFSSTVFGTQAKIAGISSAVAEYLAWLRKMPGLPKAPTDSAALLETLEARVRELQELAEEKHWVAWRMMQDKLDSLGRGDCLQALGEFEVEMRKHTAGVAREFHVSYDIGKMMQEQMTGLLQNGEA